jgi:DNA repair ATPase RecN
MALNKTDLKEIGKLLDNKLSIQNKNFDTKLDNQRKKINQDIGDLISDQILPQFDSLNEEFEGVNRKIDALFERGDRQEKRLDNHEERITELEKVSPITP